MDDTGEFTAPAPSNVTAAAQATADVFGRAAGTYDTIIPFFTRLGERLVDVSDIRPGQKVLDVACGRGASLIPATQRMGEEGGVDGIDLAPEMLDLLRTELEDRNISNATLTLMDAADLRFEADTFDAVLCGFALHFLQPGSVVAEGIRRVLRPGGRCVASVPTGFGPEWDFTGDLVTEFTPRLVHPIPMPLAPPQDFRLDQLLVDAGFADVAFVEEQWEFMLADAWAWWAWTWSQGMRVFLEALEPEALEELRLRAFDELRSLETPDGIPLRQGVGFLSGWA